MLDTCIQFIIHWRMKLTAKHGLVHASGPVEFANSLKLRLCCAPVYSLHRACVPAVNVSGSDKDLGIGVCFDQLFRKCNCRPIAYGLAVSEELVPLLATESSLAVVFGSQCVGPHQAVGRILDGCRHHVVAVVEAEFLKSGAEGCVEFVSSPIAIGGNHMTSLLTSSASATKTQCEDTHGHDTATLSAVDIGVIGEDVGDGLRGVRLESHCDIVVEIFR